MEKYKIEVNSGNGGLCAEFQHNGHTYYADICHLYYQDESECMIFDITKEGQLCFSNAHELYCKRGCPVTHESLTECIDEFIKQLDS